MIPTNKIKIERRVKSGENSLGDDTFTTEEDIVDGVVLAPSSTSNLSEPRENLDEVIVELHLPKTYVKSVANSNFVALDGPFAGRIFSVSGDSMPYAFSPLPWNRQVSATEVRRKDD